MWTVYTSKDQVSIKIARRRNDKTWRIQEKLKVLLRKVSTLLAKLWCPWIPAPPTLPWRAQNDARRLWYLTCTRWQTCLLLLQRTGRCLAWWRTACRRSLHTSPVEWGTERERWMYTQLRMVNKWTIQQLTLTIQLNWKVCVPRGPNQTLAFFWFWNYIHE